MKGDVRNQEAHGRKKSLAMEPQTWSEERVGIHVFQLQAFGAGSSYCGG